MTKIDKETITKGVFMTGDPRPATMMVMDGEAMVRKEATPPSLADIAKKLADVKRKIEFLNRFLPTKA